MAGSVRCFMKFNLGLLSKNVTRHVALNQKRTLYDKQALGLNAYLSTRKYYQKQFLNLEEEFRNKMETYVANDATGMIFTEDLKVMLHLIEKTPRDLNLIMKMLEKFNNQSCETRFGNYTFGPIVMRALYNLNEWECALNLFNNPEYTVFFNQLMTYQILMDLLYENKQYVEMRRVYNTIQTRITEGTVHPRNALLLVTAACYKENSPDSFRYAIDLWTELNGRGYPVMRRVLIHLSALALMQGQPNIALEILSTSKKPRYIGIRCIKIMAFARIDRLYDVIPYFRNSLQLDDSTTKKETYFRDTIEEVEAAIRRNHISPQAEIVTLLKMIKSNNLVQEETLDDHINTEIVSTGPVAPRQSSEHRIHRTGSEISGPKFIRRPGLRELV
ncbi:pentatricopeptide repeat-containing protein 2, mitochondrial-like isoform X1 [Venturia canescens]|uniref:pentatricopeptide repeat-containing protein 2, mitochondrial-like isoform X1 n=1 Tax=Venturia canescens TaxID=32260 RepID=UPI001C9D6651|nr:pentatricopeptide repeat-containing protein 2, mitochondrial-like isoform X1 [Venturia canescens]